jgi:NAD+ diphosphatase
MPHVNTYAGSFLDRGGDQRRDGAWLNQQMLAPGTRFLAMSELKGLLRVDGGLEVAWLTIAEVLDAVEANRTMVYLGEAEGAHHFAIDVGGPDTAPLVDRAKYIDVRSAAMGCGPADCNVLAQARSLIDWHARHGFCAVCGQPTRLRDGGYARRCTSEACGAEHFPRTDPVTIMLVVRGRDFALLGRQARFPPGNYSALAGFMEPGESIEDAVAREVFEEAGVRVREVRYHSSQPWPFPSSLMIGCIAEAATTEIALDQDELEDARWFARDDVAAMLANCQGRDGLRVPPPFAIAHQLVKGWLAGD